MRVNDQETSGRMRNKAKNLRRYWGLLLACAVAGSAMPIGHALAQEQSVAPGINQRFLEGQNFGEFIDQFEREGREIFDNRHALLREVGLKPGMTVADIGAGSGVVTHVFGD